MKSDTEHNDCENGIVGVSKRTMVMIYYKTTTQ